MEDQIFIQRRFSFTTKTGIIFNDALILLLNDYNLLSEDEIDQIKNDRFNLWQQQIANQLSTPEVPPEVEILIVNEEISDLQTRKTFLQSEIDAKGGH